MEHPTAFIETLEAPILLMQSAPRQVVTANQVACELFAKTLVEIEGQRGGQIFNCIHAFTEAGCGLDVHCEDCKIKNAVVDTFSSAKAHHNVQTTLGIKEHEQITPYEMHVSTEKVGDYVMVTIEKYKVAA